ncbi:class I SAM-dependent methyltransferase (plasmid) [Roseovarius faecimaris]|uniref:Class I SAM-dependent methyltransferase n=1 Tax=Roseovarius faecimaris TaxID=2494550 RepID=A0A6I6INM9_9RHOB|nr:class I SAM-dependent methyltransferase [Roseovarius faecimaris]QGX96786.1 class I SAM-dependent methyltransferase [Roseovarius faecimaris]
MTDKPDQSALEAEILDTRDTRPGAGNRRAYVGPPTQYDFMGATQFNLLTGLGLREEHHVVDIGCGSLRAGRYLMQYLLPGRYTGIDPNSWLWQEAIDKEIGADLIALKAPRLLDEADFRMTGVADDSADYIVAQSIYSHTGADLFTLSVAAAARCLSPTGQFLFTAILPDDAGVDRMPRGPAHEGWLYPGCLSFAEADVSAVCSAAGLHVQRLAWYHPRQTWFRAIRDPALRMTEEMFATLGTGKPLFDKRF